MAPGKFAQGVDATKGRDTAEAVYICTHVDRVLSDAYPSDAHFVAYILHDENGSPLREQPRINKGGLQPEHRALVYNLVADVDNPKHAKWRSDEDAIAAVDRVSKLVPTAAVYATSAGLRIIQPITRPLPPEDAEVALASWFGELLRRGINADPDCLDWTRHFRCPHVVRDGRPFKSPAIARRFDAVPPPVGGPGIARRAKRTGREVAVAFTSSLPPELEQVSKKLNVAIAPYASRKGSRHKLALSLSAYLLKRGIRAEYVPAMIAVIFRGRSEDVVSRVVDAQDTCRKFMGRMKVRANLDDWEGLGAHVLAALGEAPPPVEETAEPLERVTARLEDAIRRAGDGVTLIKAQCGLGKTRALRVIAGERSKSPRKRGSHVAISVPRTDLAQQVQRDLEEAGVPCRRLFGPLAVKNESGKPECRFHAVGSALARGGLSVAMHLCKGCTYADTCRAKDGVEGPDDARVTVGPHELVGELAAYAGKTGLLGIDEPPALLDVESLELGALEAAAGELRNFEHRYRTCMAPILNGAIAWMRRGVSPEAGPLARGLTTIHPALEEAAFDLTGGTTAQEWAEAAMGEKRGTTPPIAVSVNHLRFDADLATRIGKAARVLGLLHRAVLDPSDVAASVEDHPTGKTSPPMRRLVLTACERRMHRALTREGATLVLAADADVIRPLVARAVGYEPNLRTFAAAEVPVARCLISMPGANRTSWLEGGLKVPAIARALRMAVEWFLECPTSTPLAIVTYKRVSESLRHILGRPVLDVHRELVDAVRPVLALLPQPPEVGHYGALRGLDHWKDLDALATIGDPYPSVATLERQEAWIASGGQSVVTPEDWPRMHAAAELEQAHGRLRTVHRPRPARQLHIGRVLPAGWLRFEMREAPDGRPRGAEVGDLAQIVEAAGGPSAVARELDVDVRTVHRWLAKERRPPPALALRLTALGDRVLGGV